MITALWIVIAIMFLLLLGTLGHIGKMQKQIELLEREQLDQSKDIIELLKHKEESTQMLLQHIEILQYLVDKDDVIGKKKVYYMGPTGKA